MKRLFCLLLALVLTAGCLGSVCFADDPIAVVINGTEEIKVATPDEIKALISEDGTTVVKMLKDHVVSNTQFLYKVPTFTLDLNGHTAGSSSSTAIGVHTLGTKNTTTVIKNGTLIGGKNSSVALNVQVGGFRVENCVLTADNANAVVGIYQLKGDWNADNLITGSTLVGNESSALAFNSTTDPQTMVSVKVENSTFLNSKIREGTYPINERQVAGGTIIVGKNCRFYAASKMDWIHPNLKAEGEAVSYVSGENALKVSALSLEMMNLHCWASDAGDLKNSTMEVIQNVKETVSEASTTTVIAPAATASFKDVPTSFWGFDAIDAAATAGLVKGKSTNSDGSMNYAPNDTMTRAEFVTTILRLFYADEAAKAQAGAKWWTGYYDLAIAKGILKAGELDNGDLDKPMTREEMALVIHRTAPTLKGYASVKKSATSAIPDYKTVANAYKDAVLWVYGAGLIQGMDDKGTFAPQESLTRAQSATVLAKLVRTKNAGVEITLPTLTVEETAENRQKAMVETAMAYYNKGVPVQYDWIQLSRAGKEWGARYHADTKRNAPEYASADMTMYSVCSAFGSKVSMHAFGFQPLGHMNSAVTKDLSIITPEAADGTFVYQYTNTGDTTKDNAAMQEALRLMQPGDIVTYTRGAAFASGGHTVIYTYDVTGDGKDDVVHCSDREGGGRYDVETGIDKKETYGGIIINQDHTGSGTGQGFFNETASGSSYLATTASYSLLRPAQLDPAKYPMTEEAKTRLTYPGLTITYTTDTGFFGAVQKGQYITYTLVLGNKSTSDHKGLKVQIPTLDTATLCMVDGKEFKDNLAVLTVDIPAGGEVTHTFTFKALGDVGSKVVSTGYVHTIALPEMHIGITAYTPTKEQFQSAATDSVVKAVNNTDAFAEAYYKAALGKTVDIPDFETMVASAFSNKTSGGTNYYVPLDKVTSPLAKMVVTDYYGGRNVREDVYESHRVLETRAQDILPGDLLYVLDDMGDLSTAAIWVFDGQNYMALENGTLRHKNSLDVTKLHSYDFFLLVRPAQLG